MQDLLATFSFPDFCSVLTQLVMLEMLDDLLEVVLMIGKLIKPPVQFVKRMQEEQEDEFSKSIKVKLKIASWRLDAVQQLEMKVKVKKGCNREELTDSAGEQKMLLEICVENVALDIRFLN